MNKRVESFFKVLLLLNVTERDLSTNPFQKDFDAQEKQSTNGTQIRS